MNPHKRPVVQNTSRVFENCCIHILPAALGKKRMSLFQTQITNHGGTCVSKLPATNCNLTHIVLEDSIVKDSEQCVRLLNSMNVDIDTAVKIVGTQWISKCLKECMCVDTKEFELSVEKKTDEVNTQSNSQPIYEDGRANKDQDPGTMKSDIGDFATVTVEHSPPKKMKPAASEKSVCSPTSSKPRANSDCNHLVIAELQKLANAFRSAGDQWRTYGYEKAISAIRAYGSEIRSYEEAVSIPGVGSKIAAKVSEFLASGCLRKVDEICGSERSQVVELFTKVWGVGPATAQSWFQQGFRTLEDLKAKANLTKQQKIGLKHFDDLEDRMPREEVEQIAAVVETAALFVEPKVKVELCGSYRRGKTTCGDVDILLTKPDDIHTDILPCLLQQLRESGFITDDLVNLEVNRNHKKYLGVCRLPGENRKHRRLDIFVVPQSEYAAALMHYTGSALFNRSIRLLAARKGMSLSEHCLLAGVVREGKEMLNDGYIVQTPNEKSIFRLLDIEYRPPEEREHQL